MSGELMTSAETAAAFRVSTATAARYASSGRLLTAGSPTAGRRAGVLRVFAAEVAALHAGESPEAARKLALAERERLAAEVAGGGGPLMTPGQAAAVWRTNAKTVSQWADRGLLACERTSGGDRRLYRAEVAALFAGQGPEAARKAALAVQEQMAGGAS